MFNSLIIVETKEEALEFSERLPSEYEVIDATSSFRLTPININKIFVFSKSIRSDLAFFPQKSIFFYPFKSVGLQSEIENHYEDHGECFFNPYSKTDYLGFFDKNLKSDQRGSSSLFRSLYFLYWEYYFYENKVTINFYQKFSAEQRSNALKYIRPMELIIGLMNNYRRKIALLNANEFMHVTQETINLMTELTKNFPAVMPSIQMFKNEFARKKDLDLSTQKELLLLKTQEVAIMNSTLLDILYSMKSYELTKN